MDFNDLAILLHSNVYLLVVETWDEPRALTLLQKYFREESLPAWRWSASEGRQSLGFGLQIDDIDAHRKPEEILRYIKAHQPASAFVLCDIHPYLDEPIIVRLLKDIALNQQSAPHKVVLVSHRLKLPSELSRYSASVTMSLPGDEEILAIIREEARRWSELNGGGRIRTDNPTLEKLVNNLKGLPHQDVRRLARAAIFDDGAITSTDLPQIIKAKFDLMDMESVLHFEYCTAHLSDVAGLRRLKKWLQDRQKALTAPQAQDRPKGVLLFGVQGGGKSLAAKAIAGIWGLPLLRLDMAGLFNKYIGETERNLREALKLADVMAPCVLWVDELEKGLAQEDDNATSQRLLGTLLTWMSERKTAVFMVATSNDISRLPPELMRKGRFDEIFFVDLPDDETRQAILAIHLKKRNLDKSAFELARLAGLADGYTGAEIEQAVVSATYAAAARNEPVAQHHVENALVQTRPLSVMMAEKMTYLRIWAKDRAVPAD